MLKQKTHPFSCFSDLIGPQFRDVVSVDANRSRVRLLKAHDQFEQYALTRTAPPEHREDLAAAYG